LISISVANRKGGVGKSTSAACAAAEFALRGKRVLLVDADSQMTATRIVAKPSAGGLSLADVLMPRGSRPPAFDDVVVKTQIPGLDLIPATVQLASFDQQSNVALLRLKDYLAGVGRRYDFAFIDTPPNLGMLVSAAFAASRFLLVTVQAEPEAFKGIIDLLELYRVAKTGNRRLEILGALCTMYDSRTGVSPQIYQALKEKFPGRTFKTIIDRQVRLSECPNVHKPIQLHAPGSRGAQQYGELAKEILEILDAE
jgi:chromosome partitioning protein